MIRQLAFGIVAVVCCVYAMPVDVNLADCPPPNGTDKVMHWWQCSNGPVQALDVQPYDQTGTNYEYPIHLGTPMIMKVKISNPSATYTSPNLLKTVNIWKYGGWGGCSWSSVPTFGLLKNVDACSNGVPCPIVPNQQEVDVTLDFTQFGQIISLLKDNQPYQLEYLLHDKASGDNFCITAQAWAFIK
ncbi:unnamed protein product [Caenorhabditis bovis]|uniref:MD-2-related lipid-recognition domain-containing protein n=1 Tax=Caenorhabditis bovis TaxID=2654633 RepID=A0A8S1EJA8_9PELO|nr:unnamed protein product [Caenorhabditis bovis]